MPKDTWVGRRPAPYGGNPATSCFDSLLDALTCVLLGETMKGKGQEVSEWIGNVGGMDKVSGG